MLAERKALFVRFTFFFSLSLTNFEPTFLRLVQAKRKLLTSLTFHPAAGGVPLASLRSAGLA